MGSTELFLSDEVKAVQALEAEMQAVYAESKRVTAAQQELLKEMRLYSMEQMRCAARLVALEDALRTLLTPL